MTGNLLKYFTKAFSKLKHIHVTVANLMFCLLINKTEYATWQFQLCNDLCLFHLNFSKLTMHLQALCYRSKFLFTLWYSDIQRHVFYYPNRWRITQYVPHYFYSKSIELTFIFSWDRGLLFFCCWWCFITGSLKKRYLILIIFLTYFKWTWGFWQ